jgi:IS1 family transposase
VGHFAELRHRLNGNGRIQMTTDAFRAYEWAIEQNFGKDIDYAQQTKFYASVNPGPGRYSPPRVSDVVSMKIQGNPDEKHISTSLVERHNLTMRMQMRRFTRLTNAFSKKLENLKASLALYFAHYNFMRIHRTLRMPPAMEAGITNHIWGWEEMLVYETK